MLSYHADMTLENNPFEMGMDRLVDLDMTADFVSKAALIRLKQSEVSQRFVGLIIEAPKFFGSNNDNWALMQGEAKVGYITSAVHSPRLNKNIALAMVRADQAEIGTELIVDMPDGKRKGTVSPKPFFDPQKEIVAKT
jgi:aminomethyltransferase